MARVDYKKDMIVSGCVTGIEKYGIFVNLDNYYTGLIHISEISDSFVRNISDYVKIGETIKAKVIDVDVDTCHVKLSIKNVDYRKSKINKHIIEETATGFSTLKLMLKKWISQKEEEILSKK